jgi:DNA-binding NtrC family response regulator
MKKILIVDDSRNIRITLKRCLEDDNFEVDYAMNGEEAIEKLTKEEFDLVFLDLKLPVMDGMEVLRKIRDMGNDVYVVIITAYGTVENAVEAMRLGAIDFIQKPFTPGEIRDILADIQMRERIEEGKITDKKEMIEFAKLCIQNHNYDKAEEYLNKVNQNMNPSAESLYLLGVIYEEKEDYEKAKDYYRKSLNLSPSFSRAEFNLNKLLDKEQSQQ